MEQSAAMPRIVITGATGFIGRQIIPDLKGRAQLLLVGRDPARIRAMFGDDMAVCDYDSLPEAARGYDALVHLAVLNNDQNASEDEFRAVNVALLASTLAAAQAAGVRSFLNAASLKANADIATDPYAVSKAEGEKLLAEATGIRVVNMRFAAVYGDTFKGTLKVLNSLPGWAQRAGLNVLACAKPVTRVSLIAEAILDHASVSEPQETGAAVEEVLITDGQRENPVYQWIMRIIDIAFALGVLICLSWLLLIIWVVVRVTSPGPGIFSQTRITKDGQPFTCYKFRTMKVNTAQAATHNIGESAVTSIGHILRKTKIDELPQAVNILANTLSLVGPRPSLPTQTELIDARDRRSVFDVKGGITGWAQIKGIDMSEPHRLAREDAEYVARRTVLFDLKIILATFIGRGSGDRVKK